MSDQDAGRLDAALPIPLVWYTDTSRLTTGLGRCPRERFLTYHFGPASCGIRRAARNVPTTTGSHVHWGVEQLAKHALQHDAAPEDERLLEIVRLAAKRYLDVVDEKGLAYWGSSIEDLVTEQVTYIAGSVWVWGKYRLPQILATERIVMVENEEPIVIAGCSCGLGDRIGFGADHELRGCTGVSFQTKADIVSEKRDTGTLVYRECKTAGVDNLSVLQDKWTTRVQMAVATIGAETRLGKEVHEVEVEIFLKGQRRSSTRRDANGLEEKYEYQGSPLCWAYRQEANLPVTQEAWAPAYNWTDPQTGAERRIGKAFQRTLTAHYYPEDPILAVIQFVEEVLVPQGMLSKVHGVVGPLPRHEGVRADALESFGHEELKWQRICWELYEVLSGEGDGAPNFNWTHPAYQSALNRLVPQSWECRRYGGSKYACSMEPLCFKHPGWEDPLGLLGYEIRTPHHLPEKRQMEAQGVVFPVVAGEEEEE